MWTDTHCHLDACEFETDRDRVVSRARQAGVAQIVIPAVLADNFSTVRELARGHGFAYALGIHPLFVDRASEADLQTLHAALKAHRDDPRLVAIGEIGLDHFVPGLDRERQRHFYVEQLKLAREFELPVILHVRRSADSLLRELRRLRVCGGIGHAFNGSEQQAGAFIELGFKLGFGGAMTFERALQIRRLAQALPLDALVLETDAPDIPPQWRYRTVQQRADDAALGGAAPSARNEPAELPRIGAVLAGLRGLSVPAIAEATSHNARAALPRLAALALTHNPAA